MVSQVVYKGYDSNASKLARHHWRYLLHIQSLRFWSSLRICSVSTKPALLDNGKHGGRLAQGITGMLENRHGASLVLFITCTIIEGLVGPAHVRILYHACTGCIQKAEMHYLTRQVYSNYFQCEIHEQINLGRVYSMRSKFCGKCI